MFCVQLKIAEHIIHSNTNQYTETVPMLPSATIKAMLET